MRKDKMRSQTRLMAPRKGRRYYHFRAKVPVDLRNH